jgi:hypothetical protein
VRRRSAFAGRRRQRQGRLLRRHANSDDRGFNSRAGFAAWQDRIGDNLYGGVWDVGPWEFHSLSLLFIASGSLMISMTLRIPKL